MSSGGLLSLYLSPSSIVSWRATEKTRRIAARVNSGCPLPPHTSKNLIKVKYLTATVGTATHLAETAAILYCTELYTQHTQQSLERAGVGVKEGGIRSSDVVAVPAVRR